MGKPETILQDQIHIIWESCKESHNRATNGPQKGERRWEGVKDKETPLHSKHIETWVRMISPPYLVSPLQPCEVISLHQLRGDTERH